MNTRDDFDAVCDRLRVILGEPTCGTFEKMEHCEHSRGRLSTSVVIAWIEFVGESARFAVHSHISAAEMFPFEDFSAVEALEIEATRDADAAWRVVDGFEWNARDLFDL